MVHIAPPLNLRRPLQVITLADTGCIWKLNLAQIKVRVSETEMKPIGRLNVDVTE